MSPTFGGINYDNVKPKEVLFELDGFQIVKYHGMFKAQLVHRCSMTKHAELVQRSEESGEWRCTYCYQICPDEVATVWLLLGVGDRINVQKYYHTMTFTGLSEAVVKE